MFSSWLSFGESAVYVFSVPSLPAAFLCASSSSCVSALSNARLSTGSNFRGGGDELPWPALFQMSGAASCDCFATQLLARRQAANTRNICGIQTHDLRHVFLGERTKIMFPQKEHQPCKL